MTVLREKKKKEDPEGKERKGEGGLYNLLNHFQFACISFAYGSKT